MYLYFEYRVESYAGPLKFLISPYSDNCRFLLESIDPPCDDRTLLALGDTVLELVEWVLNNY